jgi:hypothetical protein
MSSLLKVGLRKELGTRREGYRGACACGNRARAKKVRGPARAGPLTSSLERMQTETELPDYLDLQVLA